jgi:enamine deaminase RidA (YjgF/YER057c/UK114 family)
MKKIIYNPTTLAAPVGADPTAPVGHFERAVRFGDWLFISGTSALTNVSGPLSERRLVAGIEAQTQETLDNIERVLQAAGGNLAQIYEIRMILKKREYLGIVDNVLRQRIPAKGFICHGYEGVLVHPDMEIEIEANAYLGAIESVERVGRK